MKVLIFLRSVQLVGSQLPNIFLGSHLSTLQKYIQPSQKSSIISTTAVQNQAHLSFLTHFVVFLFTPGVPSIFSKFHQGMDCYPYEFFLSVNVFHHPCDSFLVIPLRNTKALADVRTCPIPTVSLGGKLVLFFLLISNNLLIVSGCALTISLCSPVQHREKKKATSFWKDLYGYAVACFQQEYSFQLWDTEYRIQLCKCRLHEVLQGV